MSEWHHFIGCEGIYLERGSVLKVHLKSVRALEFDGNTGADFSLQILCTYGKNPLYNVSEDSLAAVEDLEVGSVFLEDRNEVITASGYIAWKLIFNADLIEKIILAIKSNTSEISPYRMAQGICEKQELEEYLREKATV